MSETSSPKVPLTREQAFEKAVAIFGSGAVVGVNPQYPDADHYVGSQPACKDFTHFGAGKTWDEAFENVREVLYQRSNHSFVYKGDEKKK